MVNPLTFLDKINGHIAVVGSVNADYTVTTPRLPNPGETVTGGPLQLLPGGKSANQAAAAARIGAKVDFFGAVGNDSNAVFLLNALDAAGVNIDHVKRVEDPSGTTVIAVDSHAENIIIYSPGANARVDVPYVESVKDSITSAQVLGLCLESPLETVTASAKIAHEAGMKVLLNDSPFTTNLPQELIEYCDILLVNEHELAQLLQLEEPAQGWELTNWEKIAQKLHDFGFKHAIVTLGADGSVVIDNEDWHKVDPVRVNPVDTTGCGDAFMGTVLAGLASSLSLYESAQLASYVSAYAATGRGAQASYGSAEDIRQALG